MFSELFAPVSIGVRTIAKTVRILERNHPNETSGISIGLYQAKTTSSGQLPWSAKTTGAFVSARGLWTFGSKESKALEQKGTFALISGRLDYEHSNVKRPTSFEGLYSPHTGKFDIASCALRGSIGYKMPLGNAVFTPTSYLERLCSE